MNQPLLSFLTKLPSAEKEILLNGTANLIYRYGASYLVREKRNDLTDAPFQGATTEKEAYATLGQCAYVPEVLFYDDFGNKVERYVEGETFDPHNPNHLRLVAAALRHIHNIPIAKSATPFHALARYTYYKQVSKEFLDEEKEADIIFKASPYLEKAPLSLCHNDLWQGNIRIGKDQAYLLDLEFAEASSPTFDLASLIEENSLNEEETKIFLQSYYQDETKEETRAEIEALVGFHHVLWYYWAKARYLETKNKTFLDIASAKQEAFLSFGKTRE